MTKSVSKNPYTESGVDTSAGELAVELMRKSIAKTQGAEVIGGFGGFAGLFDAENIKSYQHPILATSTDGVGTKVAIAQAIGKHDTIGQDLVAMVVDDIAVVGAKPLFFTDYIACGKVIPEQISQIVAGIATALAPTGAALIGGETAEHPGLLEPDEYDLAGAVTGVVEKAELLSPDRVTEGDVVLAVASSGLHANGYSLVRKIIAEAGFQYDSYSADFGGIIGEVLLNPTRIYAADLQQLLSTTAGKTIKTISHITGGGIAANIGRVLPKSSYLDIARETWQPPEIFRLLGKIADYQLESLETTWNLGIGIAIVCSASSADEIVQFWRARGIECWELGELSFSKPSDSASYLTETKGVAGGAVRLSGRYQSN